MNHLFNFRNRKDTIIDKYTSKSRQISANTFFVSQDKNSELKNHTVEQTLLSIKNEDYQLFATSFEGLKGPRGEIKELNNGLLFLLSTSYLPTMIFKDLKKERWETKTGGYNWLIINDNRFINSYRVLENFEEYIDPLKDHVYCLYMINDKAGTSSLEIAQKNFTDKMTELGVEKYTFKSKNYANSLNIPICELVNLGATPFDFLVFYNARDKMISPQSKDYKEDILQLALKTNSTICFKNY